MKYIIVQGHLLTLPLNFPGWLKQIQFQDYTYNNDIFLFLSVLT